MTDPYAILLSSFDLPPDERAFKGIAFECMRPGNYEFRLADDAVREMLTEGKYFVRAVMGENQKIKIIVTKLP